MKRAFLVSLLAAFVFFTAQVNADAAMTVAQAGKQLENLSTKFMTEIQKENKDTAQLALLGQKFSELQAWGYAVLAAPTKMGIKDASEVELVIGIMNIAGYYSTSFGIGMLMSQDSFKKEEASLVSKGIDLDKAGEILLKAATTMME